ncbi:SDR family NAD(P)-dependent oxidoreductase [Rhodococcus phenolicus]|uniref:SDR family NAD(P)-dependent oxidoreductase n=1 Tax=Rhodococcus phenolicus TaxID=263849 RepID=UPI00082A85EB|nr:SDR family oxidoreductase [Rhodococcus phenolicus]
MVNELSGKVAVVTGGASGIGRAIVERYIAEGARVVVADVERERGEDLVRACGPASVFRYTDVGEIEQVAATVEFAVDRFGGLDVMCNNAGIPGKMHKSFLHDDLADFGKVMAVNLLGVMAGTRHAALHMAEHGGGSIVNMSSIGGVQAGGGVMTYRASKAAIVQFTKSAAIELAQYDIRVNCIAPGSIPTALLATSMTTMADERSDRLTRAVRASMQTDRPLERDGTPEDVAEAALYFAGDRARYLTGTVLPVDGGTTAGKPLRRKVVPTQSVAAPSS